MTTTFRTLVFKIPATPLGLLPERWLIEHWCRTCRQSVAPERLLAHARTHGSSTTDKHEGGAIE